MQFILSSITSMLKNKFLVSVIGFGVWMMFFDRNDIPSQIERFRKLKELKNNTAYYNQKIAAAKAELEKRRTDPAAYERIAREKYYMKKDNEDLFIFDQ